MSRLRFHGSAVAAALLVGVGAVGAALGIVRLDSRGGAGLVLSAGEVWLLTVFTAGALSSLLGLSVLLGGWPGTGGLKERLDAVLERRDERSGEGEPGADAQGSERGAPRPVPAGPSDEPQRAGPWMIGVGAWLLALYALGWILGVGG